MAASQRRTKWDDESLTDGTGKTGRDPRAAAADPVAVEFSRRLRERLGERVQEIILFGSRARGEAREDSDYDVLVVLRDERLPRRERLELQKMGRLIFLKMDRSADVLVRTATEAAWRKEHWSTVIHDAYQEGMPL